MAKRVAETVLNASTIDILNVIRANASLEYQNEVPVVEQELDIPKVGEILLGHPALANQFINALVNRIAAVRIKSATFNNPFAPLKKGYLEFGETIEEVYVQIAKARVFSAEKAEKREFKRTLPDVRAAFHVINWKVTYPVTIQNDDLRQAFTSFGGVESMIAKIIDSVYTAAEYDEYLLFKYLLIKAVSHGKMYPVAFDSTDPKNAAVKFRGASNKLPFISKKYNAAGVDTATPKANQYIFMDADYNASYDVNVLASAFNMDKADFMGRLTLIDDWASFDNERFDEIRKESDGLEEVTAAELAIMKDVKAILVDDEWFQVYDNLTVMTEAYVAGGLYWNYFYHIWKTLSSSPFANAIVFVDDNQGVTYPAEITVKVTDKSQSDVGTVLVLEPQFNTAGISPTDCHFIQTEAAVKAGIGVTKYGSILIPPNQAGVIYMFDLKGNKYQSVGSDKTTPTAIPTTAAVGATFTFKKVAG